MRLHANLHARAPEASEVDLDHVEARHAVKVGVLRHHGHVVGQCRCRNPCVVHRQAPTLLRERNDERRPDPRDARSDGKWFEVHGLEKRLESAVCNLGRRCGDHTHAELPDGDHRDSDLVRDHLSIHRATGFSSDEHARVSEATSHPKSSVVSSRIWRSSSASPGSAVAPPSRSRNRSRFIHRSFPSNGISEATGLPSTVMTTSSPASARRSTPLVSLRSSREAT